MFSCSPIFIMTRLSWFMNVLLGMIAISFSKQFRYDLISETRKNNDAIRFELEMKLNLHYRQITDECHLESSCKDSPQQRSYCRGRTWLRAADSSWGCWWRSWVPCWWRTPYHRHQAAPYGVLPWRSDASRRLAQPTGTTRTTPRNKWCPTTFIVCFTSRITISDAQIGDPIVACCAHSILRKSHNTLFVYGLAHSRLIFWWCKSRAWCFVPPNATWGFINRLQRKIDTRKARRYKDTVSVVNSVGFALSKAKSCHSRPMPRPRYSVTVWIITKTKDNNTAGFYCLSNAMYSSIGQNIKSLAVSDV